MGKHFKPHYYYYYFYYTRCLNFASALPNSKGCKNSKSNDQYPWGIAWRAWHWKRFPLTHWWCGVINMWNWFNYLDHIIEQREIMLVSEIWCLIFPSVTFWKDICIILHVSGKEEDCKWYSFLWMINTTSDSIFENISKADELNRLHSRKDKPGGLAAQLSQSVR